MKWLRLLILILAAAPNSAKTQALPLDNPPEVLRIGVRSHARPFSYRSTGFTDGEARRPTVSNRSVKSGPLRDEGYDGYMVHICDEVLKEMLINEPSTPTTDLTQIIHVDVDEEMKDRPDEDRLVLLAEKKIDILCDPATITRDRVRRFAVSPPVFLTGVGYISLKDRVVRSACPGQGKALIGIVGSTNAASYGIRAILEAGEWDKRKSEIISAMGTSDGQNEDCPSIGTGPGGVIWSAKSHNELAREFCSGKIDYYVGDLEIITSHARLFAGCDTSKGKHSYTNDRYGIFARIDYENEDWRALRIGRFYEILNREIATPVSILDRAYISTFGGASKSRKLEIFLWSLRGAP